jgi:tRNA A37 threonylcarbamoyladenosine synthetase subunit TsaC/SUA5/YrdC
MDRAASLALLFLPVVEAEVESPVLLAREPVMQAARVVAGPLAQALLELARPILVTQARRELDGLAEAEEALARLELQEQVVLVLLRK